MVSWGIAFTFMKPLVGAVGIVFPVLVFRIFCILVLLPLAARKNIRNVFRFEYVLFILFVYGILDVLGLVSYNAGVERDFASIMAPIASRFPVMAIFLAYVFLKDTMVLNQKIGAVLICEGLVLLTLIS